MQEEIIKTLWRASEDKLKCRISLEGEPLPRVIDPYGVCTTSQNKIMLVCQQSAGFTKAGGSAGYRNLKLSRIKEVEILDESFSVSEDFNPKDAQCKEWVYHI
ncbi:MAG: WYL domain-containing protein [Cyclobacteriaceae bacterium]